jgi:DNA-binding beta-propeller fold protein YncE
MSLGDNIGKVFTRKRVGILAGILLLYGLWIYGLSTNPQGFYVDESCIAYNGYLIATTGAQDDGTKFPLYFHCYTQGYSQYMSATQPYALAVMYLFIKPSVLSARICAATCVFAAILLLGFLAFRISGSTAVGVIVALSGMATPWLFEYSRLVMELFFFIFSIVLFLFFLQNAQRRERWKLTDCILLAGSLALVTFGYASGRALAPILAVGLMIFAVNRRAFFDVLKVWVLYAFTMIPIIVVYLKDPLVISGRFWRTTNISPTSSILGNLGTVIVALLQDISSIKYYIIDGDIYLRHHVPGVGQFLVATFALGVMGIVIVLMRHRSSPWWRYVLFGLVASLIPGAITSDRYASIRGLGFPIFFLLLTVPAISWLIGLYDNKLAPPATPDRAGDGSKTGGRPASGDLGYLSSSFVHNKLRLGLLGALLLLTAIQTVQFQTIFRSPQTAASRHGFFHESYPRVLDAALAEGSRPIYLEDKGEPAYMHALWYGAIAGLDRSNFVHLLDHQSAPPGALVLSSGVPCEGCEVISQEGGFAVYRNSPGNAGGDAATTTAKTARVPAMEFEAVPGGPQGELLNPRGLATDSKGNVYVADTGNNRIQKFGADGKFILEIGKADQSTTLLREPNGVAVDVTGNIYVVDASTHKLLKFDSDGTVIASYNGPDSGFYGPRDVAIGPDNQLYIVDQGRSRIARFDPGSESYSLVWGSSGSGEGQFNGPTGIAVSNDLVFVADLGNGRVQVFDLDGKFVRLWEMPSWKKSAGEFPDVLFDAERKGVYVTSSGADTVLVFDVNGNPGPNLGCNGDCETLENPTSLAIGPANGKRILYVLNTGRSRISTIKLDPVKKGQGK